MFRRQSTPEAEPTPPAPSEPAHGKGRPTPSRREAEAARKQRVKPTLNKREARKKARAEARKDRDRTYQGLQSGDERYFPARDQGPVRRYARDFVDGRRLFTEFFLPVMIGILLLSLLPIQALVQSITLVWLAALALVVTEMVWLWFRLKRALTQQFSPDQVGRGDLFYGVMRATQLRRLRLPKPAVKPGQPPRH